MGDKLTISCSGCGCTSLIMFIFILWAFVFGLKTPWGTLNLDMFPPAIRMDK